MKQIKSVGIVGCGWLGNALAKSLLQNGIEVLATRSNNVNVQLLEQEGIKAAKLLLPVSATAEQDRLAQHCLFTQNCLVIAITPQFRHGRVDYAQKVQQLVHSANQSASVKRVILLSSTAVYNGLSDLVSEESELDLSADKVDLINQAEESVLALNSDSNIQGYVLRLSGLVGPERHPGKFLLNGRMLKSPQAPVNLIHQIDAVGLIQALIKQDIPAGVYNGVSATSATKSEYYQSAAQALNITPPQFSDDKQGEPTAYKKVSGRKAASLLDYTFVYDDLLLWLTLYQVD